MECAYKKKNNNNFISHYRSIRKEKRGIKIIQRQQLCPSPRLPLPLNFIDKIYKIHIISLLFIANNNTSNFELTKQYYQGKEFILTCLI